MMGNVGQAYAIIRGRMSGNVRKAKGLLGSMGSAERDERNRQDARAKGLRGKKPYPLEETVRVRPRAKGPTEAITELGRGQIKGQ